MRQAALPPVTWMELAAWKELGYVVIPGVDAVPHRHPQHGTFTVWRLRTQHEKEDVLWVYKMA